MSLLSSGWAESGRALGVLLEEVGPTPARRVSWRPGADGAPDGRREVEVGLRWEKEVVWEEGGAMRIACCGCDC